MKSLRPKNPRHISPDDLLPGDVLLSAGAVNPENPKIAPLDKLYMSLLDYLLKSLDEGDYTHTSLYIGKDDKGNHQIVEATTGGVEKNPLTNDTKNQVLVDAYRYKSPSGEKFGDPGWTVQPVIDRALQLVGADYAYSELLMGAIILLNVDDTTSGIEQFLLEFGAREFEHELEKWINSLSGKTPMTCVQVATTSFYEADSEPANKYGLQVKLNGDRTPPVAADTELGQLQAGIRQQLEQASNSGELLPSVDPNPGLNVTVGSDEAPLGTCTPRDMETSPTLEMVGYLIDTRTKPGD